MESPAKPVDDGQANLPRRRVARDWLIRLGQEVYGEEFGNKFAKDASVSARTVARWLSGEVQDLSDAFRRIASATGAYIDQVKALENDYKASIARGLPQVECSAAGAVQAAQRVAGRPNRRSEAPSWPGWLPGDAANAALAKLLLYSTPPPDRTDRPSLVMTVETQAEHAAVLRRLRHLDDLAGGRDWRTAAHSRARLLTHLLVRLDRGSEPDFALLDAFADCAQFVGWCEHEAGLDQMAWQWWTASVLAAHAVGDAVAVGHVMASMALRTLHVGRPYDASLLCSLAHSVLSRADTDYGAATARLRALLLIRESAAVAAAAAADGLANSSAGRCWDLLEQARTLVSTAEGKEPVREQHRWTSYVAANMVDLQAGSIALQLGEPAEAVAVLEKALAGMPDSMVRNRALGLAWLALARLTDSPPQLERAVEEAGIAAMLAVTQVGSSLLVAALRKVDVVLKDHMDVTVVREYRERFAPFRSPADVPLPAA